MYSDLLPQLATPPQSTLLPQVALPPHLAMPTQLAMLQGKCAKIMGESTHSSSRAVVLAEKNAYSAA
jgi:hypothetical protein